MSRPDVASSNLAGPTTRIHIVVADPLRPGYEVGCYPGEAHRKNAIGRAGNSFWV